MANGCTISASATTNSISVTAHATYSAGTYSNIAQEWSITVDGVGTRTGTITLPRGGSPRAFSATFSIAQSGVQRTFRCSAWWDASWSSQGQNTSASTNVTVPAVQRVPHGNPGISVSKKTVNYTESITLSWSRSSTQGNANFDHFVVHQNGSQIYSGSGTSMTVKPSSITGAKGGTVTYTVYEVHEWYGSYPQTSASTSVTVRPTFTYYNEEGNKTYCQIFAYNESGSLKNVLVHAYDETGTLSEVVQ